MSVERSMPWLRYLAAAILIALAPLVVPNPYFINLGQEVAITALAALGMNLLLGLSGQMSLGQVGFFALGAYGSAILSTRAAWPLPLSFPVALIASGLAGTVIGVVALRARTHYLAMVTLAFGFVVEIVAQRWVDLTGGSMGLIGVPQLNWGDFRYGSRYFFWTIAATLLLLQIANDYVMVSRPGRLLRTIKESESFAATVGINAPLWRAGIFVVSALFAGLGGAFFAHQSGYISSDAFTLDRSIALLITVVIGGLGHPYGALLGAILLVTLNQVIAGLYEISLYIFGGILLAVMLFLPEGAAGAFALVRGRMRRLRKEPAAQFGRMPAADLLSSPARSNEPLLVLQHITKAYAGVVAVDDVSMVVQPATVHALIGPNGAGKSTLINVIGGLYAPDGGRIRYAGLDVTAMPAYRRARLGLARTFQNLQLIGGLTAIENVMLGFSPSRGLSRRFLRWLCGRDPEADQRGAALALLDFFGMGRHAGALPGDLSYGHRKLVELARALAQRPRLMLLDEPIAGLNEEEAREITRIIGELRRRGVTILLVEHNMSFVMSISDTITVLDYGEKIGEGTPAAVRADPAVVKAYLGVEAA
jgi:branched-chain amino acid transport system ATP-binding protein/branched-chain amino acid transport system permease protein